MTNSPTPQLLVIGALHVDEIATAVTPMVLGESNPVRWSRSVGGVAANVARSAAKHKSVSVVLLANTGRDKDTDDLSSALAKANVRVLPLQLSGTRTGRYSAVLQPCGELLVGLADVEQAHAITLQHIEPIIEQLTATALVLDTNLSAKTLLHICTSTRASQAAVLIAAIGVSPSKIKRLDSALQHIDLLFCNESEAHSLTNNGSSSSAFEVNNTLSHLCLRGCRHIVMTRGTDKVHVYSNGQHTTIQVPAVENPYSVNGPGDALAGATLSQLTHKPLTHDTLVYAVAQYGIPAAAKVVTGEHKAPNLFNH